MRLLKAIHDVLRIEIWLRSRGAETCVSTASRWARPPLPKEASSPGRRRSDSTTCLPRFCGCAATGNANHPGPEDHYIGLHPANLPHFTIASTLGGFVHVTRNPPLTTVVDIAIGEGETRTALGAR